jgi:nicotinate phosphoribosyltransferase
MKSYNGFVGTSNPYLAMECNTGFVGTFAHQWVQIWSALMGMRHANKFAMEAWVKVFRGDLGIALTDTYGTDAFLADFDLYFAKLFDGVRWDSGDGFAFTDKIVNHYRKLGINTRTKTIVFSDSLNVNKTIELQKHCNNLDINCSFGIGTHLTNHFDTGLPPLNIVIKLVALDGVQVCKLSDSPTKAVCGDSDAGRTMLRIAKNMFLNELL